MDRHQLGGHRRRLFALLLLAWLPSVALAVAADARMTPPLVSGGVGCQASYGTELAAQANATDLGGTETDTTTGWTQYGTLGTWDSVTTEPYAGLYHLTAIADSANDGFYRAFPVLSAGTIYRVNAYAKHNGTGGTWSCFIYRDNFLGYGTANITITNTETTYKPLTQYFLYNSAADYYVCGEGSATNDGGIYLDAFSLRAATLCLGSELHTTANAASLTNEAGYSTGFTTNGLGSLEATTAGSPPDGTYQLLGTPTQDGDGFYYDLNTILTGSTKYFLRYKAKVGTSGKNWTCGLSAATSGTLIDTNQLISSTASEEFGFGFTHHATNTRYFRCAENHADNTGALYFDALSVKEITGE